MTNPRELLKQDEFSLNISVDDGLYAVFPKVKIRVQPSNIHTPSFERSTYRVVVPENYPPGVQVVRVVSKDKDNGVVTYSLPPQRGSTFFSINNTTGQ